MINPRDRVKHQKHGLGTAISFPNDYIVWVHFDKDPEHQERGCYFNTLERIDMSISTVVGVENTVGPLSNNAVRQAEALTNNLANVSMKKDDNKTDYTMLTLEMIELVSKVRMFGAKKYARGNFKITGFKYTRSLAAALRHVFAFLNGEDNDPESGLSHLGHAVASLEHCIYDCKNHPENDDRKS